MKIAIISDSHDNWTNLKKAVEISNTKNCEYLLFAGDLIAPYGMDVLADFKGSVKVVWGNNEGEKLGITKRASGFSNIELCGDIFEGSIGVLRVFMNHYPRVAELAAKSGDFDLCIHGHTHVYRNEIVGNSLLLNPADVQGHQNEQASFIVFDCENRSVERVVF